MEKENKDSKVEEFREFYGRNCIDSNAFQRLVLEVLIKLELCFSASVNRKIKLVNLIQFFQWIQWTKIWS